MILLSLLIIFTQLSLLAFGGGNAVLPEMQHQVVAVHHWMTSAEFNVMFAMAQAAPGPNMMIVPLIGWHVAGPMGLLATSIAKFAPSSIVAVYAFKGWNRFQDHPWRALFEQALKPITVGLVLVSAYLIADVAAQNSILIAIICLSIVLSLFKNVHPLWLMLIGAVSGIVLL